MSLPDRADAEAARIYQVLFRRPIPEQLKDRFVAASQVLEQRRSPEELRRYRAALALAGDLESLEVASRYTRQLPLLVKKFELMVRLAETAPENQGDYVNGRTRRFAAFVTIASGAFTTLLRLARGLWLLRRARRA